MRAKQRTLLVLLGLIVLAGAALALLTLANRREEEAASAAEAGTIPLSSFAVEDLTAIQYTWQGQTVSLAYEEGVWTLADDPDYHLDQTKCDTMAAALADLKAKRRLEAPAGEDYGFAVPLLTVTVTAAGQTNTFTFGDTNTVTGDIYLQKAGDGAVYPAAAAKAGCFEYGKAELFEPFNPAGITASRLECIEYTLPEGETVRLQAVAVPAGETEGGSAPHPPRGRPPGRLPPAPHRGADPRGRRRRRDRLPGFPGRRADRPGRDLAGSRRPAAVAARTAGGQWAALRLRPRFGPGPQRAAGRRRDAGGCQRGGGRLLGLAGGV